MSKSAPITPIQDNWLEHMLTLVPEHLQHTAILQDTIKSLLDEITSDFDSSMKKATGMRNTRTRVLLTLLQVPIGILIKV